jgi:arylsulfatase A-like enzyme
MHLERKWKMSDISSSHESVRPQPQQGIKRRELLLSASSLIATRAVGAPIIGSVLASQSTAMAAENIKPPHIVHIISDDQGWKDVGFHGSDIKTPNIDKLATTGVELQQFYTQPFCSQTRAAMLTGRYPFRYGMQIGAIPSGAHYGVPTDEWYLPQSLREAGYTTALVGKWHVGHAKREFWPRHRGFDYFYGALVGEIDYFTHAAHGVVDWYRNNEQVKEKGYVTSLIGNDAVRLIEKHDPDKPLYLYLAFTSPHTPYQAPQEYLDKYMEITDPDRRAYAAMITAMDDQIGRVVDALEQRKMRDNAIILFHSDNGGTRSAKFTGESVVKGELPPNNGPYRDGKGTLYEGGTRVVALANWPGRIKPGKVNGMMHVVDLFPTLIGLAGGKFDKSKPVDGLDVWPTISEGKPSPRTELVYNVDPSGGAIREGDWKVVWLTLLPGSLELFNLADDPSEKTNLADESPDKVKALQGRLRDLATQMKMPFFLTDALRSSLSAPPSTPQGAFTPSD